MRSSQCQETLPSRAPQNDHRDVAWASIPVAVVMIDESNHIIDTNPSAEMLFNRSAKGLTGQCITDLIAGQSRFEDSLRQVRQRQSPALLDDVNIFPKGQHSTVASVQLAPVADETARLLICIRSREIEGKISSRDPARSAARSVVGMADMLSHEIRNPLSGIIGAAQLLAMKLSTDDLELTELIIEEAHRIRKLVEQVDQFGHSKVSACQALNIHDLLDRAHRLAKLGCASDVEIETDYDPSLPEVWGDHDQLLRVFLNLVQNSAEALGQEGGQISIRTCYDRSLRVRNSVGEDKSLPIQVDIRDNGPGLSKEIAAHAFEPFVSGRKNGTGLGLALVSAILSDLGGWISFDSQPGHTVFRVSLPTVPKRVEAN